MDDWNLEARPVSYDGTSQEHARDASLTARCPACQAPIHLGTAAIVAPATIDTPDLERLLITRDEPVPGHYALRTVNDVDTQVRAVDCACGGAWLAACSYREWQNQRWVALEPLVVDR